MTDVLKFHAPGPWLTRDLKECVLASDYDGMGAAWRNACERGDKAVARLAEVERVMQEYCDGYLSHAKVVARMLHLFPPPDSASVKCRKCGAIDPDYVRDCKALNGDVCAADQPEAVAK